MNFNHKIEKHNGLKPKCLMDSESVAKDKRYKLGVWLHGEYRAKLRKAHDRNTVLNSVVGLH
jgi:hypothetical protein